MSVPRVAARTCIRELSPLVRDRRLWPCRSQGWGPHCPRHGSVFPWYFYNTMYQPSQTPEEKQQEDKINISWLEMTKPYTGSKLSHSMFRGYFNLCFIFCIFFIIVYPILNYWDKGVLFSKDVIELLEANLVLDFVGLMVFIGICVLAFVVPQRLKRETPLQITFIGAILLSSHYIVIKQTSSYSDRAFIIMLAWGYSGKLFSYYNTSDGSDSFKNKMVFLMMPDLIYNNSMAQVTDPTLKINKLYLFKKFFMAILGLLTNCVIIIDFINPIVAKKNSLTFLELMFKLIPPSCYMGLSLFYLIYENVFSGIAELLRLKNRRYFEDWWNAKDFYELLWKVSTGPKEMVEKHIPENFRVSIYLFCIEAVILQCFKRQFTFNAGILFILMNLGVWSFGKGRDYMGFNNYIVHVIALCFMPFLVALELKYKIF